MDYSVVIPARDAAATLPRVLDALAVQEPRPLEVIVVVDTLFCAAAREAGLRLVFDPRFTAAHEHERRTFADLRRQQRRLAYGLARARSLEQGRARRLSRRLPLDYFLLLRLPVVYRKVVPDAELRRRFLALLPRLAVAEWTLGASAMRQAARRPALRGGPQPLFE